MEVQDFFYLCKIYHPAWIQVDRRNVQQSKLWLYRPLYHKTGKHALRCEIILWQISFRVFIEPSTNQDWLNCLFLRIQTKRKLLSVWDQQTIHESGVGHRHLVAGLENAWAGGSRFERVGSQNFNGKWSNWLPVKIFFLRHLVDTLMHLWDQKSPKSPHRNPLKNGSLSENVMKEGERALFQPWDWKRYRRGLRCGHFATSTDLLALILAICFPRAVC